jgi:hypothetical protein
LSLNAPQSTGSQIRARRPVTGGQSRGGLAVLRWPALGSRSVLLRLWFGARSQDDEYNPSGFDVPEHFREPDVLGRENHLCVLMLRHLVAGHVMSGPLITRHRLARGVKRPYRLL